MVGGQLVNRQDFKVDWEKEVTYQLLECFEMCCPRIHPYMWMCSTPEPLIGDFVTLAVPWWPLQALPSDSFLHQEDKGQNIRDPSRDTFWERGERKRVRGLKVPMDSTSQRAPHSKTSTHAHMWVTSKQSPQIPGEETWKSFRKKNRVNYCSTTDGMSLQETSTMVFSDSVGWTPCCLSEDTYYGDPL